MQCLLDSFAECSVSGSSIMKLHVLQSRRQFGPETGSSTTVPSSHSGQAVTPMRMKLWRQPECGQSVHGMPALPPAPCPLICTHENIISPPETLLVFYSAVIAIWAGCKAHPSEVVGTPQVRAQRARHACSPCPLVYNTPRYRHNL